MLTYGVITPGQLVKGGFRKRTSLLGIDGKIAPGVIVGLSLC